MRFLKPKIKCDKCSLTFSSQEKLMQHEQVVHGKNIPYDCKECNQDFSNMEDMRSHLQRYHSYKKDRT
ncbi:C2H2-type zinc finger protein [Candidatus Nitrosotenuis sp. DW1]|uniref:C2H2-type zinc finger protein n=1 Tax=Candidatus Nitrosotenuis sp. DW1 TaxID=2259672 RepID=UPI0015CB413C|nr:C2H2-type zinc finger protein [Candidatus Nitrosotenuis sp. DW1]QLH09084.1 hypothetical protein DSQ19_06025 [Candidatus Nitrosotenuis sp. DW1]